MGPWTGLDGCGKSRPPTEFDPRTVQPSRYTDYASTGTKYTYGSGNRYTVELHLYGLISMVRHLDMQNIRIIGIFFENRLLWKFEVKTDFYTRLF